MAKKSLGQHWLNDAASLAAVVAAGEIEPEDTVLEIGPGHGSLTRQLSAVAKRVVAVEADSELAARLARELTDSNVEVAAADIRDFDLRQLPAGYKVVANIPYYLTSRLMRMLLEAAKPPALIALLVQQEVAQRITARPGAMSVLAVSVQYYGQARILGYVAKEKFQPAPKVDSAILQIKRREKPAFATEPKALFRLIKAGFGERRKQLKNSLAGGLRLAPSEAADLLKRAGIASSARAQELSLSDWQKLYEASRDIL